MSEEKRNPLEEALVHLLTKTAEDNRSIEDAQQDILRRYDAMELTKAEAAELYFDLALRRRETAKPLTTFIDAVKACQEE